MKHKSCPTCGDTLVDEFKCSNCGWVSKNFQTLVVKQCFHCHEDIPDGKYYRIFHSPHGNRYKCSDCLLYADLDWRDKHYLDWLELHPEFKFKPVTKQDQIDLQEMCMAYMKKFIKGVSRKLPYDKSVRLEKLEYNEAELIARAPKEITFADLEEPL